MGIFDWLKKSGRNDEKMNDELRAAPISRVRMDLLWYDRSILQIVEAGLGTSNVIMMDNGKGGATLSQHTKEDIEWARPIINIAEKADTAAKQKQYREAIKLYCEALKLAPGCDMFLMSIGCCYANMGELRKGLQYLERAAEISPGNERINRNLSGVRKIL